MVPLDDAELLALRARYEAWDQDDSDAFLANAVVFGIHEHIRTSVLPTFTGVTTELFENLRELALEIENVKEREKISESINAMESTAGTKTFITHYQQFMSVISNHISVFKALLPALASLLG